MQIKKTFVLIVGIFGWISTLPAQDLGTEVINVVKPYTPSVSDAEKLLDTPPLMDSLSIEKKPVNYSIQSVPVASTFVPDKGRATQVQRKKAEKIFDNYASIGVGNYTRVFAELYSNFEISRNENFDIFLRHNSAQGGIKEVELDDKFYATTLDVAYHVRERDQEYQIGLGLLQQVYNWYGLPDLYQEIYPDPALYGVFIDQIDPTHSYFGAQAQARAHFYESVFSGGNIQLGYFGDSQESSEIHLVVQPEFVFDLSGLDVGVDVDIDYLNGKSERMAFENQSVDYEYGLLKIGGAPYVRLYGEDYELKLGAKLVLGNYTKNSQSDFYIYPNVTASYNLSGDAVIVYGGVGGDLDNHTYRSFTQENPFIAPGNIIAPTDRALDAHAGLRGKFSEIVSYDVRVTYKQEKNKPYYRHIWSETNFNNQGFAYGNSFGISYDHVNTFGFYGELKAALHSNYDLGVNLNFWGYDTELTPTLYNLPTIKAAIFATGNFTEQFYGGANLYFVGERKDRLEMFTDFGTLNSEEVTLESYFDVNLNFGYHINDQLSVFVKGNNLLGKTYEKWLFTPVMGFQVLGGLTYKFDW